MYRPLRTYRHRAYRWAYMASLKRAGDFSNENSNNAMKRVMLDSMSQSDKTESRHIDVDSVKPWCFDDLSAKRIGRSIEDVEREAMNHLFGTRAIQEAHAAGRDSWRSPLRNICNYLHSHRAPKEVTPDDILHATTNVRTDVDTFIDPITNRRVPKEKRAAGFTPKYDDVDQYEPDASNEPDGLPNDTSSEVSKQYSDLHRYELASSGDPIVPTELTPEQESKEYKDLDGCKPVQWNESDGLPEKTEGQRSKDYEDLSKYKASFRWNEPDGLHKLTPEEESKQYKDLATYNEGFVAGDAVLEAHEQSKQDTTQKGQPLAPKNSMPVEDGGNEYSDLDNYGPVMWNEPDGLRKLTPEEESKNYGDLQSYGAYQWNEPDGLQNSTPEEKYKDYKDLQAYGALNDDGPGQPREHSEKASRAIEEVPEYAELENGNSQKKMIHPKELTKNYDDLQKYDPQQFDSPYESYSPQSEETSRSCKDMKNDEDAFSHEPDSLPPKPTVPAADSLEANDSKLNREGTKAFSKHYNDPEAFTAQEIRDRVLQRAKDGIGKSGMEDSKTQSDLSWDATAQKAREDLHLLKSKNSKLTGNYVRDFPDEFAMSWSTSNSTSRSCLFPQDQVTPTESKRQEPEQDETEISSMDESFPVEPARLQTARSRGGHKRSMTVSSRATATLDPYSTEPQGLETSYAEEVPDPTTAFKHYEADPATAEATASSKDPTRTDYLILAYDPSTQSIRHGSTSSSVADSSSPPSPAEIIPRMSNPSKFLPVFTALQRVGYEIVSGSGDVMVFRRASESSDKSEAATPSPDDPVILNLVRRSQAQARPRRRFGRKMLYGIVWIVGGAYSVGVLAEYFSTGGFDGLGSRGL